MDVMVNMPIGAASEAEKRSALSGIVNKQEEIIVVVNTIKNLSKLVVSKGTFSEVYNYSDSKKYFYETISFEMLLCMVA